MRYVRKVSLNRDLESNIEEMSERIEMLTDSLDSAREELALRRAEQADYEMALAELAKSGAPETMRHLLVALRAGKTERYLIQCIKLVENASKPRASSAAIEALKTFTTHPSRSVADAAARSLQELSR